MTKDLASSDNGQMDVDLPSAVCEMDEDNSDSDDSEAIYAFASEQDDAEDQRIEFFRRTCGCHFGPRGVACCSQFPRDDIASTCRDD